MDSEKNRSIEIGELVRFLSQWGKQYEYDAVVPENDEEKISAFTIDLTNKKIYVNNTHIGGKINSN